jgi:cyclohexanone monooxygenase
VSSLDRAGMSNYLIVEQGNGFGGTWYWNRHPGITVDIPSFSYRYLYAKRRRERLPVGARAESAERVAA